MNSGRIAGLLQVHAEVDQVDDDLRMALCCMPPPIRPKLIHGLPSFVMNAGMMVWKGRLPGSKRLACSGSKENNSPRSWKMKPIPEASCLSPCRGSWIGSGTPCCRLHRRPSCRWCRRVPICRCRPGNDEPPGRQSARAARRRSPSKSDPLRAHRRNRYRRRTSRGLQTPVSSPQ